MWHAEPTMHEVGEFVARFHEATARLAVPTQRPHAMTLQLTVETLSQRGGARASAAPAEVADAVRSWNETLAQGLAELDGLAVPAAIHGDATTMNVLASGSPRRPCGLIDFEISYVENEVADIAFGLWQSARRAHGVARPEL